MASKYLLFMVKRRKTQYLVYLKEQLLIHSQAFEKDSAEMETCKLSVLAKLSLCQVSVEDYTNKGVTTVNGFLGSAGLVVLLQAIKENSLLIGEVDSD